MSDLTPVDPSWQRLRGYLHVLAKVQIGPHLRGRVDPSSVVQQTLREAHRDRDSVRVQTQAVFVAWLRGILFRNIQDAARKAQANPAPLQQSSQRLEQFLAAADSSPSDQALRHETLARLGEALERLPADQRTAVELKHLHGRRVRAIAAEMERSENAVAGLLRRGLKTLRDLLREP